MTYKAKQTWKDLAQPCKNHDGLTRRDFLAKGMATGFMSLAMHKMVMGDLMSKAYGATTAACPTPVKNPGAIGQLMSNGGPTMGARFIGDAQAAGMNPVMAANYGITGTNLVKIGPNLNVDSTSPFGAVLLAGPQGYVGGAAAWKTNVLSKLAGGAHLGQFNQDDGAGQNTGLLGGVSPFKSSIMGKDLKIGVTNTVAKFAAGSPAAAVSFKGLAPASFSTAFSLTPPAMGLTDAPSLTAASDAATALQTAMSPVFNISGRKGASDLATSANCAFYGNSALADPNYGTTLFTPANITALTAKLTVPTSTEEQAILAASYQSALGTAGGLIMQFDGRDYHGQNVQTSITPADVEEARAIVMFLAGCDAAQAKGAFMYFANGQAIAKGTTPATTTINGATVNVNGPTAQGDAGGAYNAGLIIFFDPKGATLSPRFTGTTDGSGNAKIDANVPSAQEAVAGLYLSALAFVNNGTVPAAALTAMQATGVAGSPKNIMVI